MSKPDIDAVFRCACGGNHYFEINMIDYEGQNFFISFTEHPKTLRQRLRLIKAIFTNQTVYHGELHVDDVKEFKKVVAKL